MSYNAIGYRCAQCGAAVELKVKGSEAVLIRTCEHVEAAVTLELQAHCTGEGLAE